MAGYTSQQIFDKFKEVEEITISGVKYKVEIIKDLVVFKHKRSVHATGRSEIHERWTIQHNNLLYWRKNLVTDIFYPCKPTFIKLKPKTKNENT